MAYISELLTALLEYLNLFDGFIQSTALLFPQNASIIPDSYIPITLEIFVGNPCPHCHRATKLCRILVGML